MTDPANRTSVARRAIHGLLAKQERLVVMPQNLYEFWAVATRKPGPSPAGQNGLGITPARASQWLRFFQRRFNLLFDREDLVSRWHDLVRSLAVTGLRSCDARFVAAMQTYGITRLLTFNLDHYRGFPVTLIDPTLL